MQVKLREEIEKYDGLLDEKLEVDEKLRLGNLDFEEVKAKIEAQEKEIAELKAENEQRTKITDDQ